MRVGVRDVCKPNGGLPVSKRRLVTVSARVSVRTHRLAEAVAELRGTTLSSFVAQAVEHAALRELRGAATEPELGTTVTPQRNEVT